MARSEVREGEFVGQLRAGESMMVSVLAWMYNVNRDEIRANGGAIEAMVRDYGMIAIADRPSTVTIAGRISTVDVGVSPEEGTSEKLLAVPPTPDTE